MIKITLETSKEEPPKNYITFIVNNKVRLTLTLESSNTVILSAKQEIWLKELVKEAI